MTKPGCREVQQELKAYLDGALNVFERLRVRRHLAACEACRHEVADLQRIGKELQNMAAEIDADAGVLDPGLRARILAAVPAGSQTPAGRRRPTISFRGALAMGGLTAAAALVVMFWLHGSPTGHTMLRQDAGTSSIAMNKSAHASDALDEQVNHAAQKQDLAVNFAANPAAAPESKAAAPGGPGVTAGAAQGAAVSSPQIYYSDGRPTAGAFGGAGGGFAGTGGARQGGRVESRQADEPIILRTHSLAQATARVQQAAMDQSGTIESQARAGGNGNIVITVNVPTTRKAAFINSILLITPASRQSSAEGSFASKPTKSSEQGKSEQWSTQSSVPPQTSDTEAGHSSSANSQHAAKMPSGANLTNMNNTTNNTANAPQSPKRQSTPMSTLSIRLIKEK